MKEEHNVIFEEEGGGWGAVKYYHDPETPNIIKWVMKASGGFIKSPRHAGYALLGIIVVIVVAAAVIYIDGNTAEVGNDPIDAGAHPDLVNEIE